MTAASIHLSEKEEALIRRVLKAALKDWSARNMMGRPVQPAKATLASKALAILEGVEEQYPPRRTSPWRGRS